MISIFYIFLALMGLNLLVFIHELGHYIVARREGMRVHVFSIGFGKPFFSWMRKGVKWQICPFLFGGYVRIAGMEKEGDLEPYEVKDGFYSKKPWARIKVALAGPIVNLVFALFLFSVIWAFGGREKPFSQFTKLIGYMDPTSELYQKGVRPGDEITEYNGEPFTGYKDLIYAAIMNGRPANVEGNRIDYYTSERTPYDYTLTPYESPKLRKGFKTVGILAPASFLIYSGSLYPNLPLEKSGIEQSDRIVWVDGELIFSSEQLSQVLNSGKALLTIERDGEIFLGKVPRIPLEDLRLSSEESIELHDWEYDAALNPREEISLFIPYNLTHDLRVQNGLFYLDSHSKVTRSSSQMKSSPLDTILKPGDRILAVDGIPVNSGVALLTELQTQHVQIIVKRGSSWEDVSWKDEDRIFESGTDWDALTTLTSEIGTAGSVRTSGKFHLLNSVTPIRLMDFPLPEEKRSELDQQLSEQRQEAEKISNVEEREQMLDQIKSYQNRLMLGAALQDRTVTYNPTPFALFTSVFQEISRNLIGLFSGHFSPKHFGGPIFIVQVMQQSWGIGIKEALFWLGAISLNLGFLNLLPIPVLDGGHICFSIIEKIRKKPLKAKTMQRLILPFVALLIFMFIYLTYNDLTRIFGRFFP
ncbi:MAG: putative zinc metalloprotease [Chlamydiae bacterium]|nr:putative zinc metalloprotease [Chlamydiota bacterium]